ncbi:hypothetical protein D3C77_328470 [compost metagenome]
MAISWVPSNWALPVAAPVAAIFLAVASWVALPAGVVPLTRSPTFACTLCTALVVARISLLSVEGSSLFAFGRFSSSTSALVVARARRC